MIDFAAPAPERFAYALENFARTQSSIGTYNERSMHAFLKQYIEPDTNYHEVPVGRFVADICNGEEICEIQTSQVFRMRAKLTHFLEHSRVTLVCPLIRRHYTAKYDPETGEFLSVRITPRRGYPQDIALSLSPIRDLLANDNLRVWVPYLDVTDLRPFTEKGKRGKKTDTIPRELADAWYITCPRDLLQFLPENLADGFTTKDVALAAKCHLDSAQSLMTLLHHFSLVTRERQGNRGYAYTLPKE